jgi:hypothetical protein
MILPSHRENDIAEREFRLCEIPANKVAIFRTKIGARETLLGKEKAGAPIHEQPRGFVQRNAMSGTMVLAAREPCVVSLDHPMPGNQVVIKHRDRTPLDFAQGEELEFDIDVGEGSQFFGGVVNAITNAALREELGPAEERVELHVIVRLLAGAGPQNTPFTATVAAAQNQSLQISGRDDREDFVAGASAKLFEPLLQRVTAIQSKPRFHAV